MDLSSSQRRGLLLRSVRRRRGVRRRGRRERRWLLWGSVLGSVLVLLLGGGYLLLPEKIGEQTAFSTGRPRPPGFFRTLFGIRRIEIRGNARASTEDLRALLGSGNRPFHWELGDTVIVPSLLRHPWVDRVSISRSFLPPGLEIWVGEAEPALVAELDGVSWLFSSTAQPILPLEQIEDPELIVRASILPRLMLEERLDAPAAAGDEISRFRGGLSQAGRLKRTGSWPFGVESLVVLADGALKVFPLRPGTFPQVTLFARSREEIERSMAKLQLVLADLREKGEHVESIDLRFANQAVVDFDLRAAPS